jgi:plasmid stabilization system protein ParE
MKRRVSIRPDAQRDIKEAIAWYEGRERDLGIRFKDEIRTTLRRISDNAHVSRNR